MLTFVVRPRRRLRAAGGPDRAGAGTSSRACSSRPSTSARQEARRGRAAWRRRAAGRSRWRSTRTARVANLYGVGGCPTTVFAARRHACARREARQPHRGTSCARRRGGCADDRARARPAWTAGSSPSWPRSSPSCASCTRASTCAPGALAARGEAAPARCWPTATPAAKVVHMRQDPVPVGLPRLLAPGGHRPRHRPHAGGGGRARAPEARRPAAARTWSTTRSRSRSPRPACR